MHELTLLYGVADRVRKVCEENDIPHVDAIVLEVGEATAIIPDFLKDGYEIISDDYDFLRGRCRNCGCVYPIVENKGHCPECDSFDKEVIEGTDFLIKEVRVMEED